MVRWKSVRKTVQQFQAEDAQHHADGQASRVTHEYLLSPLYIAEHIIIEERYEHTKGGEGKHGVDVLVCREEDYSVEKHRHPTQTGSQSIDAVNQVDGIDDEHL